MYYPLRHFDKLNKPIACCPRCKAGLFILPDNVNGTVRIVDTIMQSTVIPPQPQPRREDIPKCATCDCKFIPEKLLIKEGENDGENKPSTNR